MDPQMMAQMAMQNPEAAQIMQQLLSTPAGAAAMQSMAKMQAPRGPQFSQMPEKESSMPSGEDMLAMYQMYQNAQGGDLAPETSPMPPARPDAPPRGGAAVQPMPEPVSPTYPAGEAVPPPGAVQMESFPAPSGPQFEDMEEDGADASGVGMNLASMAQMMGLFGAIA